MALLRKARGHVRVLAREARGLVAQNEDAFRIGALVDETAGFCHGFLERGADRVEGHDGILQCRANHREGQWIADHRQDVAGPGVDIFARVVEEILHRYPRGATAAGQFDKALVDWRVDAAGRGDDVEQPVATGAERHPGAVGHFARDRHGIRNVVGQGHDRLRLDRFAGQPLDDHLLDFGRRLADHADAACVGHGDRPVPGNDLFGDDGGAGTGRLLRGHRTREKAAGCRFEDCDLDTVADADALFDRPAIVAEAAVKARAGPPGQGGKERNH